MLSNRVFRTSIVMFALVFGSAMLFGSLRSVQARKPRVAQAAEQKAESPVSHGVQLAKATLAVSEAQLTPPISNALSRITKKPFGLEVHPETSPVPNDKFNGFHAGVDFETTPDEQDIDVPITAACTGPLLIKKWATGYGGVAVQHCVIDGQDISVIYGHINIESVTANVGDMIRTGEKIAVLGKANSTETDGARKHLHFGLRKGLTTDIRGYVKDPSELTEFLDAMNYIKF